VFAVGRNTGTGTVFMQYEMEKVLRPYFELTNAVRIRDLELFRNIADKFLVVIKFHS
jgi:26S proteasome regulatory subunit N3